MIDRAAHQQRVVMRRHDGNRQLRPQAEYLRQRVEARGARHVQVPQQQISVRFGLAQPVKPADLFGIADAGVRRVVIGNQEGGHGSSLSIRKKSDVMAGAGRGGRGRVPPPGHVPGASCTCSHAISAPCARPPATPPPTDRPG
ncbi:hypothetical protein G6F24_016922 [Rhizopus arrhizus]|nr:hypothetical protein G6F24_016922 [Rhizopus arrhizus]